MLTNIALSLSSRPERSAVEGSAVLLVGPNYLCATTSPDPSKI